MDLESGKWIFIKSCQVILQNAREIFTGMKCFVIIVYASVTLCVCINFPGGNELVSVVSGTRNDIVILPLSEETEFTFFSSPVDNVGNRRALQSAVQDASQLTFPIVFATCPNNCSNNGNCTVFGDCVCDSGFYGGDCSEGKQPELQRI